MWMILDLDTGQHSDWYYAEKCIWFQHCRGIFLNRGGIMGIRYKLQRPEQSQAKVQKIEVQWRWDCEVVDRVQNLKYEMFSMNGWKSERHFSYHFHPTLEQKRVLRPCLIGLATDSFKSQYPGKLEAFHPPYAIYAMHIMHICIHAIYIWLSTWWSIAKFSLVCRLPTSDDL